MTASLSARPLAAARPVDASPQRLDLPAIDRGLSYGAVNAWALAQGLLRSHALDSARAGRYGADFQLSKALRLRWHQFFRTDPTREIPYLFHSSAATLLTARLMADLGLNLRHVTPLRQVVQLVRDAEPLGQVPEQRLDCRLQRVTQLATGVVSVQILTTVSDQAGLLLATQEDSFAVRHLDTALLPDLQHDRMAASRHAQLRHRQPQIARHEANLGEWVVGADWGRGYGRLAGALSLSHGSVLMARLSGQRAPTLPTGCLRNLLVRQLADVGVRPERLTIQHCRPVYLDQRISIAQRDDQFEVSDARGVLLAFGSC